MSNRKYEWEKNLSFPSLLIQFIDAYLTAITLKTTDVEKYKSCKEVLTQASCKDWNVVQHLSVGYCSVCNSNHTHERSEIYEWEKKIQTYWGQQKVCLQSKPFFSDWIVFRFKGGVFHLFPISVSLFSYNYTLLFG